MDQTEPLGALTAEALESEVTLAKRDSESSIGLRAASPVKAGAKASDSARLRLRIDLVAEMRIGAHEARPGDRKTLPRVGERGGSSHQAPLAALQAEVERYKANLDHPEV